MEKREDQELGRCGIPEEYDATLEDCPLRTVDGICTVDNTVCVELKGGIC